MLDFFLLFVFFFFKIWNPVPLVYCSTRWYVLELASMYSSGYKEVQETSKWYIPVRTDIRNSYGSTYRYVPVCTALYLHCTRWYKVVQGSTWQYKMVHGGTSNGIWRYMELSVLKSHFAWSLGSETRGISTL